MLVGGKCWKVDGVIFTFVVECSFCFVAILVLVASSFEIAGLCHAPPFNTDCPASALPGNDCVGQHGQYVHTFSLGGVLLEGLRIRLTSHYSREAAGRRATSHYTQGLVNILSDQMSG